jgi:hypothetical protein
MKPITSRGASQIPRHFPYFTQEWALSADQSWLDEENGCVRFCANALGLSVKQLSAGIRRQMAEIDGRSENP